MFANLLCIRRRTKLRMHHQQRRWRASGEHHASTRRRLCHVTSGSISGIVYSSASCGCKTSSSDRSCGKLSEKTSSALGLMCTSCRTRATVSTCKGKIAWLVKVFCKAVLSSRGNVDSTCFFPLFAVVDAAMAQFFRAGSKRDAIFSPWLLRTQPPAEPYLFCQLLDGPGAHHAAGHDLFLGLHGRHARAAHRVREGAKTERGTKRCCSIR